MRLINTESGEEKIEVKAERRDEEEMRQREEKGEERKGVIVLTGS